MKHLMKRATGQLYMLYYVLGLCASDTGNIGYRKGRMYLLNMNML